MLVLDLPNCVNARDLVGTPLGNGRTVRAGALMRSDNHDRLTSEGIDAVRRLELSRILDLRFEWEARHFRSPFADDPIYLNVPMLGENQDFDPNAPDDYRPELDECPQQAAAAFIAFAEAPPGPVLVHCNAGRDRAGILTAFALAVAGASMEVIVADYDLSEGIEAETMRVLLTHLDQQYGGVAGYLAKGGVSDCQLEAAAARLVAALPDEFGA